MRFSILPLAIGLLPFASAVPLEKRALSQSDIDTLQLALYLENLEFSLYTGGFNNFDDAAYRAQGFPPGFRDNVGVIAQQEGIHIRTISTVLSNNGVKPVPKCEYTFNYTDPISFVSLANMITTVGIGAYIGGATNLTDNAELLLTAGSIVTNEARHDTFLRDGLKASPFPTPFDTALTSVWAYNLAQMFVVPGSCPQDLPIIKLPKLNNTTPMKPTDIQTPKDGGATVSFSWDPSTFFVKQNDGTQLYIALLNQVTMISFVPIAKTPASSGSITVPKGVAGVAFAALTTFGSGVDLNGLTAFGTLAGPSEVVLG
ncbi:MAG: hypothetical protein M1836_006901 [Candelina mexicana]|nr:MAG: hypothetical protein M1836_006901 [Candelina mexicana]